MKIILRNALVLSAWICTSIFAKEPIKLIIPKQQAIQYHNSGKYDREVSKVMHQATVYVDHEMAKRPKKAKHPAIILDIDETALSNYSKLIKYGKLPEANKGMVEAIKPTLQFYNHVKAKGVAVFFITGRDQTIENSITVKNLAAAGYKHYDGLIFKPTPYQTMPAAKFKKIVRKTLTDQGFEIIANIGDQMSDLVGGYSKKTFKLPNPYYHVP